jgi:site-specific recombinase XerD
MAVDGATPRAGVDVVVVAEEYLAERRLRESDAQVRSGHSHQARALDLCRWGLLLAHVQGRRGDDFPERFELADCLAGVATEDFSDLDLLVRALGAARAMAVQGADGPEPRYATATLARMLSTLRGFAGWLASQDLIAADVTTSPRLSVARVRRHQLKALDDDAVAAIVAVASEEPPPRSRMWWPSRDLAVIEVLAGCGLRASELCAARTGWLTHSAERPLLHVIGKGDKARRVPVAASVDAAVAAYLDERRHRASETGPPALGLDGDAWLFVRTNGRPFDLSFLDRLVRGLAERAGVTLPERAAVHSVRHHFGSLMARRGVPVPLMQQALGHASADTTAVYTTVAEHHLIAAFDDAGLLE